MLMTTLIGFLIAVAVFLFALMMIMACTLMSIFWQMAGELREAGDGRWPFPILFGCGAVMLAVGTVTYAVLSRFGG